jgi:hypothetical protein
MNSLDRRGIHIGMRRLLEKWEMSKPAKRTKLDSRNCRIHYKAMKFMRGNDTFNLFNP